MKTVDVKRKPRVAIIGAGISGLICARTLLDQNVNVKVFEKSRGVGGRMATRRTPQGPRFDHGAQYFTVRDQTFECYVKSWMNDRIVAPWDGRICTLTNGQLEWKQKTTPRFVGVPGMNAICRHLAADLDIQFSTQVRPPKLDRAVWQLTDDNASPMGEFDSVITSAPAPQSARLLASASHLQQTAEATEMNGCWSVMLAFDRPLDLPFDGAFVHDSPLSWIARNDSKPGRKTDQECWILHASPLWTGQWIEEEPEEVRGKLIDAFWQSTGARPKTPSYCVSHRWRYAIPAEPVECRCLFDDQLKIGACGDWCGGPRVEGAMLSGLAMARRVLACK